MALIPGWGKSPGEGNGNLIQYSCLGNPMDRGIWRARVYEVAKSLTKLSTHAQIEAWGHRFIHTCSGKISRDYFPIFGKGW